MGTNFFFTIQLKYALIVAAFRKLIMHRQQIREKKNIFILKKNC